MSQKIIGHHGWQMEKTLDFELPKTAQMALKIIFSRTLLQFFRVFLFVKRIFANLFFLQRFFHKNPDN